MSEITIETVTALNSAISPDIRAWLNARHISDEVIQRAMLGYGDLLGDLWLTIPIFDKGGQLLHLKLKRPPTGADPQPKGKFFPGGSEATLYPLHFVFPDFPEEIVLCEGEPDCLALWSHGIPALTSTAGAGTFQEEWLEMFPKDVRVILCFDMDEAGKKGEAHVTELFRRLRPDIRLGTVDFTTCVGKWGKDITDFFMNPLCWPKADLPPELPQSV